MLRNIHLEKVKDSLNNDLKSLQQLFFAKSLLGLTTVFLLSFAIVLSQIPSAEAHGITHNNDILMGGERMGYINIFENSYDAGLTPLTKMTTIKGEKSYTYTPSATASYSSRSGKIFGYQMKLFEARDLLDTYVRYMWTQLSEKDMFLDGQDYHFDAINSHQVRAGSQYNFGHASGLSPCIGVAVQYEFDGEAGSDIRDTLEVERPNITGLTGLVELGIRVLPNKNVPVTLGMNIEALYR